MLTAKGVLTGCSVAGSCALGRPLAVLPTAFSLFRVAPTSYPIDSALSRHVCLCGSVNPGGDFLSRTVCVLRVVVCD